MSNPAVESDSIFTVIINWVVVVLMGVVTWLLKSNFNLNARVTTLEELRKQAREHRDQQHAETLTRLTEHNDAVEGRLEGVDQRLASIEEHLRERNG